MKIINHLAEKNQSHTTGTIPSVWLDIDHFLKHNQVRIRLKLTINIDSDF